jgi:tRNA A-37 threonylcarbamoyl transferase component Bud32
MQELTGYESVGRYLGIEYDDFETRSRYRTNTRAFPRAEVARAFTKLHALKVTHGDPSLNNIMLHPLTRDVKLVDYAYARYERRGDRAAEFAKVEWDSVERQAREADELPVRSKRRV